jgi:hypothetical protein
MTKQQLAILWSVLVQLAALYVYSSHLVITGGNNIFKIPFPVDAPTHGVESFSYFTPIIAGTLYLIAASVALAFALKSCDQTMRLARVPALHFLKFPIFNTIDVTKASGKAWVTAMLLILVIVPFVLMGHAIRTANKGVICEQADGGKAPYVHARGNPEFALIVWSSLRDTSVNWPLLRMPERLVAGKQLRLMPEGSFIETKIIPASAVPLGGGSGFQPCGGTGVELGWWTPILAIWLPILAAFATLAWLLMVASWALPATVPAGMRHDYQ